MTIAELLVQTTATLMAGSQGGINRGSLGLDGWHNLCAKEARRIVAAVYNEPCDGSGSMYKSATDGLHVEGTIPALGSDTCDVCGWPRSQHGAKP